MKYLKTTGTLTDLLGINELLQLHGESGPFTVRWELVTVTRRP